MAADRLSITDGGGVLEEETGAVEGCEGGAEDGEIGRRAGEPGKREGRGEIQARSSIIASWQRLSESNKVSLK